MFLTLTLLVAIVPQDQDWAKLSARPLGFAAEFPVKPKQQKLTDKGPDDKEVKITIYRAESAGRSFLVTVSKFSDEYIQQPLETIFDNSRNGSLARSGGKLVSEKKIKIGKHEARDFIVAAGKNAGFVRAWITVANGQQYAVMIAAKTQDAVTSDDAERFFKAFKITEVKE